MMKKYVWFAGSYLVIFTIIVYLMTPVSYAPELENASEQVMTIETGEICPIYIPTGEVHYNSEWTGERPAIDNVTTSFKTATFALG